MKKALVVLTGLSLITIAPAFADDNMINQSTMGITGSVEKQNSSGNPTANVVSWGVEGHAAQGGTSFDGRLGGTNNPNSDTNVSTNLQLSTDWSDYGSPGNTVLGTTHYYTSSANSMHLAPVGIGFVHLSQDNNTRMGAYVVPWEYYHDGINGMDGNGAALQLLGEANLGNMVRLNANLKYGVAYGQHRDLQTTTNTTQTGGCSNSASNPANSGQSTTSSSTQSCTQTTTTTTSETQPGFSQSGAGRFYQAEIGVTTRVGQNGYVKVYAVAEGNAKSGYMNHFVSGQDTAPTSLNSTSLGAGVSIGAAF